MQSFEELRQRLSELPDKKRVGLVAAQDEHSLDAVVMAAREGLVEPVLLGEAPGIKEMLKRLDYPESRVEIEDITDPADCARRAAQLAREGRLDCIMKGKIETAALMKVMVDRETGIRKSGTMSAVAFFASPYYHKLFGLTDAGLLPYPTLEQKRDLIENAAAAFHALGVSQPKVAVLAAVEKVNPKMKESVEAAALKDMNSQGQLTGCLVEGPISYDLAMSREAAEIKGFHSEVAGDADILVAPDLVCGNSLYKCLAVTGGAKFAGAVFGARIPLILTSRSSSTEEKYLSIVLNALVGQSADVK